MKTWLLKLAAWGPLGILLLAIIDSAGVPLPVGVDALLVILSAIDQKSAVLSAVLAIVGSTIGCLILFFIGRQGGKLYLDKKTSSGRALRFRQWFQKYGLWTVFFPTLIPVPLPTKIFILSAGALGVSPLQFGLVIVAARAVRYSGLAYCGALYGKTALNAIRAFNRPLTIVILLLLLLAAFLIQSMRKRKSETV